MSKESPTDKGAAPPQARRNVRKKAPDTVVDAPDEAVNKMRQALSEHDLAMSGDSDPFAPQSPPSPQQGHARVLDELDAFADGADDEATALLSLTELMAQSETPSGSPVPSSASPARPLDGVGPHALVRDDVSQEAATHHQLPAFRNLSEIVPLEQFDNGREPTMSSPVLGKQTVQPSGLGSPAQLLDAVRAQIGLVTSPENAQDDASVFLNDALSLSDVPDDDDAVEISAANVASLEALLDTPDAHAPAAPALPPREADLLDDDDDEDSLGLFADEALTPSKVFRLDISGQPIPAGPAAHVAKGPALVDEISAGTPRAPTARPLGAPPRRPNTSFRDAATDVHAIKSSDMAEAPVGLDASDLDDNPFASGSDPGHLFVPDVTAPGDDSSDAVTAPPEPAAVLEGWADASVGHRLDESIEGDAAHLSELGDEVMGVLIVDVPEDAVVFIDGVQRGSGRTEVGGLGRFQSYALRVHARGFRPWSGNVSLDGEGQAVVKPELAPR